VRELLCSSAAGGGTLANRLLAPIRQLLGLHFDILTLYVWPEGRKMFLVFLANVATLYAIHVWAYDCACGLSPDTIRSYATIAHVVVGYVHSNMHWLVRRSRLPFRSLMRTSNAE
jgi:hypothetical protein